MKLVFCGTPPFAVPTLRALADAGHEIALVVTQPDRGSGRGLAAAPPAVKMAAAASDFEVTQPEKIKDNPEFRERLAQIAADAIVVVAYGRIIPNWMLDMPRYGNVNLHGSLLPKYRGAAPVQWSIANGECETGVTTMLLNEGLDTGDLLLAHKVSILPDTTAPELFASLAGVGASLMVRTLEELQNGTLHATPQNHALATRAPLLKRQDGEIDFSRAAQVIYDRWRGFLPWPGAFTRFRGKRLAAIKLRAAEGGGSGLSAGELAIRDVKMLAGCGSGSAVELHEVQVEGNSRVTVDEFIRGYQVRNGERLGG